MNGKINTPRTVCKASVAVAIAAIAVIRMPKLRRRASMTASAPPESESLPPTVTSSA